MSFRKVLGLHCAHLIYQPKLKKLCTILPRVLQRFLEMTKPWVGLIMGQGLNVLNCNLLGVLGLFTLVVKIHSEAVN